VGAPTYCMGFFILFPAGTDQGAHKMGSHMNTLKLKLKKNFTLHEFYIIEAIKRITDKLLIY
jgi:hypothetical protein